MNQTFNRFIIVLATLSTISTLYNCESEAGKQAKEKRLERKKYYEQKRIAKKATEDSLRVIQAEINRKDSEFYDKFINNSLRTGATPYAYLYGPNSPCNKWGCSNIKVNTPSSSDVLVTIKRNGKVIKHAYIKANSSYTFDMLNGTYQPFFYYGKGWNPQKIMKKTDKGIIRGGFVADEHFGKDDPQYLNNNRLEYTLILQQSGNFSERASSANEAF